MAPTKKATIVVGLGFGDEGKGTMVDALCRAVSEAPLVIRFNGGHQAAHNVITPDGRHHTFAQFGSGSLVPNVRTLISSHALFEPFALLKEAEHLEDLGLRKPLDSHAIDRRAMLVTPFHRAANRIREALRSDRHGSCGLGIGEAMADRLSPEPLALFAGDLQKFEKLEKTLSALQERKAAELLPKLEFLTHEPELPAELSLLRDPKAPKLVAEKLREAAKPLKILDEVQLRKWTADAPLIFEGAQGVLLDEWYGFHPHTTWSTTTTANAESILRELGWEGEVTRLGVLRSYHSRHGAGPFPSEDKALSAAMPDAHNGLGPWQGTFRLGHFDRVLARYALDVCPVDALALTHLDRLEEARGLGHEIKMARSYDWHGEEMSKIELKSRLEDLDFQEALGQRLSGVRPILVDLPQEQNEFIEKIESELELPIRWLSEGPSAREKRRR